MHAFSGMPAIMLNKVRSARLLLGRWQITWMFSKELAECLAEMS